MQVESNFASFWAVMLYWFFCDKQTKDNEWIAYGVKEYLKIIHANHSPNQQVLGDKNLDLDENQILEL